MRNPKVLLAALLLLCTTWALGATVSTATDDPEFEKRVNKVAEILRCLVCQNQTIADSHAELAVDLKNQIREKLKAGMSEKEITDFMVQRYGDFVLYNPPVKATTWLLWFGPFVLLLGGVSVLFAKLRKRAQIQRDELSEAEHRRAMALLEEGAGKRDGA